MWTELCVLYHTACVMSCHLYRFTHSTTEGTRPHTLTVNTAKGDEKHRNYTCVCAREGFVSVRGGLWEFNELAHAAHFITFRADYSRTRYARYRSERVSTPACALCSLFGLSGSCLVCTGRSGQCNISVSTLCHVYHDVFVY